MFSRRSNHSWLMTGSVLLGGFLLGISYNKYGQNIKDQFQRVSFRNGSVPFMTSDPKESDDEDI